MDVSLDPYHFDKLAGLLFDSLHRGVLHEEIRVWPLLVFFIIDGLNRIAVKCFGVLFIYRFFDDGGRSILIHIWVKLALLHLLGSLLF